jgi:hypothetical protein
MPATRPSRVSVVGLRRACRRLVQVLALTRLMLAIPVYSFFYKTLHKKKKQNTQMLVCVFLVFMFSIYTFNYFRFGPSVVGGG